MQRALSLRFRISIIVIKVTLVGQINKQLAMCIQKAYCRMSK